jgi:CO dehydrogenase/acetyl-CoA synthase beta subunit
MGLFDEQVAQVRRLLHGWNAAGLAREFRTEDRELWPDGSNLVLQEDSALELGNPSVASLTLILWTEGEGVDNGRITLVGPDVGETTAASVPFAQVVIVSGEFENEYESYRDVRDAVYDARLEGFSVRTLPSKQSIWCRVSRGAFDSGFSLADVGAVLLDSLSEVEEVTAAEVLFVTESTEEVKKLGAAASGAQRIVDALMKMYQEENFDCETCEYQDVCDTVMDLKVIREKLAELKASRNGSPAQDN